MKWLVVLLLIAGLGLAGYTELMLRWSYSTGERAGYVQKLSKKGWIRKTWEGEMALASMPGTVAERFAFSVRDDAVAQQINENLGHRVAVVYEQHVGLPTTCFGETQYFVTKVSGAAETP